MLKKIINNLNEPFPNQQSLTHSFRSSVVIAIFITLFLTLFKPFGLHNIPEGAFFVSLQYGLVTLVFGFSFELLTRYVLKIRTDLPSWTLWKWVVMSMILLLWIAFGNFLMMLYHYGFQAANWHLASVMLKSTLYLGILPVFVSGLLVQMSAVNSNESQARSLRVSNEHHVEEMTQTTVQFELSSSALFEVSANKVLFVEAMQNYIMVHYLDDDSYATQMVRCTIAHALATLNQSRYSFIVRCHRSYLVNLKAVNKISGNAQGLKLAIKGVQSDDVSVPVSRSYVGNFKIAFAQMS